MMIALMDRRLFLAALAAGTSGAAAAAAAGSRPNILFIAVDDLRPELGCYGARHIHSPHIDTLARSGVVFDRAYCQQALCNPSRASLMTGLRPDTLRVWDLKTDFRTTTPGAITIPQHFRAHGYHAAVIGKIFHNIFPDPASWSEPPLHIKGYPFDPDAVYRDPSNVAWLEQRQQEIRRAGNERKHIDRLGEWYLKHVATEAPDVPDDAYFDGAQTSVAIRKLGELKQKAQPFFFGVGYYRPHLPFNAPRRYWQLYDRAKIPLAPNGFLPRDVPPMAVNTIRELRGYTDFRDAPIPHERPLREEQQRLLRHGYFASVSYIDAQIGRLLGELDRLGLRENTIVVLWGDHGWKLGEHASWAKMTNFEVDTRVPLIVRDPRAAGNGRHCHRLVEFVDIYPTLCESAGLPLRPQLEGRSFAPLLQNPRAPGGKTAVFSQFLTEGIWAAPDGREYMGRAVRTDRYRYVEWTDWQTRQFAARELYDHRTDPQENQNISGDPRHAKLIAELAAKLRTQR